MPLNNHDTLTPFRLPPDERLWDEIRPLVNDYKRLVQDRHLSQHRLDSLKAEHDKAERLDKVNYGRAMREGKPDPGNAKVKKVEQEQEATKRKIAALEDAILDVEAELEQAFEDSKASQVEGVDAEIETLCDEYQAAIAALQAARWKLSLAVSLKRFLNTFPERDWNPGEWPVYKLQTPSGDPYYAGDVFEALAFDVDVVKGSPISNGTVYLGGNGPREMGSTLNIVGDTPEEPYYGPMDQDEKMRILKSVGP